MNYDKIPHLYHSTTYSLKLFEMLDTQYEKMEKLNDDLTKVEYPEDMIGVCLDDLGRDWGESRNGDTDEVFRERITFAMTQKGFFGTIQNLKQVLEFYYETNEISIQEFTARLFISVPDSIDQNEIRNNVLKLKAAGIQIDIEYFNEYIMNPFYFAMTDYKSDTVFIGTNIVEF